MARPLRHCWRNATFPTLSLLRHLSPAGESLSSKGEALAVHCGPPGSGRGQCAGCCDPEPAQKEPCGRRIKSHPLPIERSIIKPAEPPRNAPGRFCVLEMQKPPVGEPVAFSSDTNRAIPSPALLPCGQQGPTPADGPQRNSRLTGQIFPKMLFFHERRSGFCENVL